MKRLGAALKTRFAWMSAPAGENNILLTKQSASVARWVAGVGGITFVVAISFSTSAYTSLIQVYDKCHPRMIASDAILGGRIYALFATVGAAVALLGLMLPHFTKQCWYNWFVGKARRRGASLPSLQDWHPTTITALLSSVLVAIGFCVVVAVSMSSLSDLYRQTPDGLARYIEQIDARCLK